MNEGGHNGDYAPELLSAKELAARLKRHRSYVAAMKRRGFRMVAGRTTVEAAMLWLGENGGPWRRVEPSTVQFRTEPNT